MSVRRSPAQVVDMHAEHQLDLGGHRESSSVVSSRRGTARTSSGTTMLTATSSSEKVETAAAGITEELEAVDGGVEQRGRPDRAPALLGRGS